MKYPRHGRRLVLLLVPLTCALGFACSAKPQATAVIGRDPAPPPRPVAQPTVAPKPTSVLPTAPASRAAVVLNLGTTIDARPLTLHLFGDTSVGPDNTVLILGGIHGNEPTSAGVCRELVAYLGKHPETWQGRCIAVIPEANPDGLARRMRTNTNLVDLNRNFPAANWKKTRKSSFFGGDAPASQPETKLLMAAVEKLQPARIVSVHSMQEPCNNYDGPGETLAKLMAIHNGYSVKASIGYPTPGSFGSWAGGDRQIPVITLELPSRGTTPKSWEKNRPALLAFIRADRRELATAVNAGINVESSAPPGAATGK